MKNYQSSVANRRFANAELFGRPVLGSMSIQQSLLDLNSKNVTTARSSRS